jgi:hypothetical protein
MLIAPSSAGRRVIRGVPSAPERRPSVSVVIPAYNYARYLRECVESVLSQRDVDVVAIIVDDGSSDETPAVCRELADAEPRVVVIRNEPNRGHIPSVNIGLARVTGDYVVKLDADDLLAPGALARATALLESHPNVTFVYGRPDNFSGSAPAPVDAPAKSWSVWSGQAWVERRCRRGTNVISQPEVVMRTSALRASGPVREDLPHTSDLHTWLKLAAMGDVGRVNGPVAGYYRVHDQSMQRTVHSGRVLDYTGRRDAFDAAFDGPAGTLPDAVQLHDTARRALAMTALERASRAFDRGHTAEEPIDDLVAFALETWPAARTLPEWDGLQRRRALGADRVPRHPRYIAKAVSRRALEELGRRRWLRTGEW